VNHRLEQEIIKVIAEESGKDIDDIKVASDLYSLGIDSLSALEILAALEKRYDITIPENDLRNINSTMEIARLIAGEIEKRGIN
jgi:acyl carrier protein